MSKCTLDTRKHTLLELGVDSASELSMCAQVLLGGCWECWLAAGVLCADAMA